MRRPMVAFVLLLGVALQSGPSAAVAEPVYWPVNGHWYEKVMTPFYPKTRTGRCHGSYASAVGA
jgi:hypothetical protein